VELQDGVEISSDAFREDGAPKVPPKDSSLSRIEVVNEVWVHSSPRREEPVGNVRYE
jgi:hypothetical protein